MSYLNNIEVLKAQMPMGAEIVTVKGERVRYFKDAGKNRLLTFHNTMWVKTWITKNDINLERFDFIAVI